MAKKKAAKKLPVNSPSRPRARGTGAPSRSVVYQFRITLLDMSPSVWRRIQIVDCTLDTLHQHIQAVMNWSNTHLHHFVIGNRTYGVQDFSPGGMSGYYVFDSSAIMLSSLLPTSGKKTKFSYTYDFGDNWEHEILFEGCLKPEPRAKYPLCLEGERARPPEDSGGPLEFGHILKVLANPAHKEYEEVAKFYGSFDPEAFDPKQATARMVEGLWA
jgi:hypothetical protein